MVTSVSALSSPPAGYRFPREVIAVAVRWYLRYGLSYRDVEELLAERGIEVDHVTVYRWVQTFTPEFIDAARPARHATGDRWFVDETYVKVCPKTVRNVHRMLHRAFRDAVAWRYIAVNPADHASLPRTTRQRTRPTPWTLRELNSWLQTAIEDRDAAMWILAATTGMRRSELAGARRDLLDLDQATLLIDPTRIVVAGRAQASDGKRLPAAAASPSTDSPPNALPAHLDRLNREQAAWGAGYHPGGLLFCHPDGRPLHPDTITRRFNRLVDRAGVPRIRLHDVRHTYATLSIDAGIDPKKISDRIGHASVAFTLATYTHPSAGRDCDAAETFAAAVFGSPAAPDRHD